MNNVIVLYVILLIILTGSGRQGAIATLTTNVTAKDLLNSNTAYPSPHLTGTADKERYVEASAMNPNNFFLLYSGTAPALAGKKFQLLTIATLSKISFIEPVACSISEVSTFGHSFGEQCTESETQPFGANFGLSTESPPQQKILTCDHTGQPSCYSIGSSKGQLNTQLSCSTTTVNSFVSANASQVNNFCSGYRIAAQQALQQQR
jgi:hypothetical protein